MNEQPTSNVLTMKPCPMCGTTDLETSPWPANRQRTEWIARCGNPLCSVEIHGPSPEECARRWNRRAADEPKDAHQLQITATAEAQLQIGSEKCNSCDRMRSAVFKVWGSLNELRVDAQELEKDVFDALDMSGPPCAIRELFNKGVGVQNGNRFHFSFETDAEADAAFEYIAMLGNMPAETKSGHCRVNNDGVGMAQHRPNSSGACSDCGAQVETVGARCPQTTYGNRCAFHPNCECGGNP